MLSGHRSVRRRIAVSKERTTTQALRFGTAGGTTDEADSASEETEQRPLPSAGNFDAYFATSSSKG